MSAVLSAPSKAPAPSPIPKKRPLRKRSYLLAAGAAAGCVLLVWGGVALYQKSFPNSVNGIPTVKVARGDVSLPIYADGSVEGGNSQTLTAPMTGASDLHILTLKANGAPVRAGEAVVEFDTTDKQFALKEAEADMAEAEQHILQATTQFKADAEEARYELGKGKTDLELAQLEARKNPILSGIVAKQNDLAVEVAKDKLAQLEQDRANRKATGEAGIEIQEAARGKAESNIKTARQNIEAMTLRAQRDGYVAIKQAPPSGGIYFGGSNLPLFQVGDSARPGVAIAEIPDLSHWEVAANIAELDRGHLTVGDPVNVTIVAFPNRRFHGRVADIGTTTGGIFERRFDCKVALDEQPAELRPGLSARVEITAETLHNALWLPAQAVFESDGKIFVYLKSGKSFARKDVVLVRRNESRVILTGLQAGQEVALANPTDAAAKPAQSAGSPLQVIPK